MARFSVWFVWKKAYKTLVKNKSKTIPILVLLVFAIAFGSLMFSMQDFRTQLIGEIKDYTNVPDATAYFQKFNESVVMDQIENITDEYLDDFELRMMIQVEFKVLGEIYDGLLVGVDTSRKSHMHALVGEDKKEIDDYEFALNWGFAQRVNLEKGDEITLLSGSVKKDVKIKSIGYNAEFQYTPLYPSIAFPSMRAYPILYVDIEYLNEVFLNQTSPEVNQLLYQLKDSSDESKVEDEIDDALKALYVEIVPLEDQAFFEIMRKDEVSDRQMLMFLTIILLAGAIITLILVMNRLVEEDLKTISVFQALGANKREVTASYLLFNVIIVSVALILGVILSNILGIPFKDYMSEMFAIGFVLDVEFHYSNAIWIGLILFIISIISTFLVVKKTFKMDVQQSLKYETKFLEKKNLLEKIYVKSNKDPHPFTKYNLRRIFGRKMQLVSLLIALSFSGSFLIFVFGINDGMAYSLNKKFTEIETWDCVASTWRYENQNNMSDILDSLSEIDEYEFSIYDVVFFSKKDSDFSDYLRIIAYEEDSKMHLLEVEEGKELRDDNEVLVTRDILNEYHLEIGDSIYVKSISLDDSQKVKIVGVAYDIAATSIVVSIKDAQKILNQTNKVNTILIKADDDIEQCAKEVQDLNEIQIVTTLDSLKDEVDWVLEFMSSFIVVFGVILMAFGIILITVVFKSIVDYRVEDYSNMKSVGILDKELRKSLLTELVFYYVVSLICGFILGVLFLMYMFVQWQVEIPGLIFYIYPVSYLYYVSLFSALLAFSFYINYWRVKKINIAEIMRAKTFG